MYSYEVGRYIVFIRYWTWWIPESNIEHYKWEFPIRTIYIIYEDLFTNLNRIKLLSLRFSPLL